MSEGHNGALVAVLVPQLPCERERKDEELPERRFDKNATICSSAWGLQLLNINAKVEAC